MDTSGEHLFTTMQPRRSNARRHTSAATLGVMPAGAQQRSRRRYENVQNTRHCGVLHKMLLVYTVMYANLRTAHAAGAMTDVNATTEVRAEQNGRCVLGVMPQTHVHTPYISLCA